MSSRPFLHLLLFFALLAGVRSDLVSDRAALLAFHAAVGGSRLNWSATASTAPCLWFGISCGSDRVVALRLPGSGLSGEIPPGTLGNLTALRTLSLRLNHLSGRLPADLSAAQQLHNLYLQGNRLSGSIPSSLFSLHGLVRLNLAGNNFSGDISPAFSNLTRLSELYLESNRLSGEIPDLDLPRLVQFNVSFNELNGSVPASLRKMPATAFLGMQLCGGALVACAGEIIPSQSDKRSKLSGGAIAGIAIGSVVLLIIIIGLILLCRRKPSERKLPEAELTGRDNGAVGESQLPPPAPAVAVKGDRAKKLVFFGGGEKKPFELEDLLGASAEVLGKGAFGTTYKAVLETGTVVAVKRLKDVNLAEGEFRERIESVGAMEHPNVVPLLAFYFSKDEKLLVYDFMPMGSLSALLHGNRGSGRTPVNWETRSGVALAAARGIGYIHSVSPSASHGNIKSSNVLLTAESWPDARVSDHGLASLVGPASSPARIAGYRAPEVADTRGVSQKSDVYSFGVLLLELLTGKPPHQSLFNEEGVNLPRWVQSVVREEWVSEVFDLELLRYQDSEEQMVQLLQLAVECTAQYPVDRPSMPEVVARIEDICRSSLDPDEQNGHQADEIDEAEGRSSRRTDSADGSRPPAADS